MCEPNDAKLSLSFNIRKSQDAWFLTGKNVMFCTVLSCFYFPETPEKTFTFKKCREKSGYPT